MVRCKFETKYLRNGIQGVISSLRGKFFNNFKQKTSYIYIRDTGCQRLIFYVYKNADLFLYKLFCLKLLKY